MTSLSAAILAARYIPKMPKAIPPPPVAELPQELPECNTVAQSNTEASTEDSPRYGCRAQDGDENLTNSIPCVPMVSKVVATVAAYYGTTALDLVSWRKTADVVRMRHVAMYLARHLTTKSYPAIGKVMSDRDHTTIMHGVQKITRLMLTDLELAFDVAMLTEELQRGG